MHSLKVLYFLLRDTLCALRGVASVSRPSARDVDVPWPYKLVFKVIKGIISLGTSVLGDSTIAI